jgi:hypothetical protein
MSQRRPRTEKGWQPFGTPPDPAPEEFPKEITEEKKDEQQADPPPAAPAEEEKPATA